MAGRRPAPLVMVAAACAGAAAWCSAGALTVIDAAPRAPRAGVLPPLWLLPALIVCACAIAWIVRLRREHAWPLFLPLLAVLPWLPGPVPLTFLMWNGPIVAIVWAITAASVLIGGTPRVGPRVGRLLSDPSRAPLVAAILAFVAFTGAAAHLSFQVSGDEPHYLIVTQSILHDFDLRIENNHREGQFTSYVRGELKPDYLRRGADGQIYSIHAPGLPALVAPAFALFGHRGAIVFLALLSAAAGALAWRACAAVSTSAAGAWFGWASVMLTVPFFFQSFAVYPDAAGAAAIMCGVVALTDRDAPSHRRFWYGAAVAILPWLHTRLVLPALALAINDVGGLFTRRVKRPPTSFFVAPIVSAIAWFAFFYRVYGTVSPAAPYGGYTQSALTNIPRGLTGLLVDQQFGVLANAPVLAIALAGFIPLFKRQARLAFDLLGIIVPYTLAASAYYMWWGGHSSPGRFLVAVLPALAIPAAAAFDAARSQASRTVMLLVLAISLAITAIFLTDGGRAIFNARDGSALWLEAISPLVDLARGVPSVLRSGPLVAIEQAVWWMGVLAAFTATVVWLDARRRVDAGLRALLVSLALAIGVMVGAAGVWCANGVRDPVALSSQLAVLRQAARTPHGTGVKFSPFQLVSVESTVARLELAADASRVPEPDAPALTLRDVPAGVYRLRVRAPGGAGGVLEALAGDAPFPFETWPLAIERGREIELRLTLPVAADSVQFRLAAATQDPIVVTVRPLSLIARHVTGRAFSAAAYGPTRAFFLDGRVYPEPAGIWFAAGTTRLLLDPPAKSLFLRNANVDNHIAIETSGIVERVDLRAREERTFTLPPSAEAYQLLRVTVDEGVVPAVVDRASADFRNLGVWVAVR